MYAFREQQRLSPDGRVAMHRGVSCRIGTCGFGKEDGNNNADNGLLSLDLYRHIREEHLALMHLAPGKKEEKDDNSSQAKSNDATDADKVEKEEGDEDWPVPKIAGLYSLDPAVRIIHQSSAGNGLKK